MSLRPLVLFAVAALALAACPSRSPQPQDAVSAQPSPAPMPDTYFGSITCQGCHTPAYDGWAKSWMARSVRTPVTAETELIASSVLCGGMPFEYVLGGRITLRYVQKKDDTHHIFLPCEYSTVTKQVQPFRLSDWQTFPFEEKCAACHMTNYRPDEGTATEPGVGCESCHGPASRHGLDFKTAGGQIRFKTLTAVQEGMICGSCHLQGGTSKFSARRYPEHYTPGDDLFEKYTFSWADLPGHGGAVTTTTAGDPVDVHQKLLVKLNLDGASLLRCTSCHTVHTGPDAGQHVKHKELAREDFCFQCHTAAPDGKLLLKEYKVQCPVCEF
jgi:predicted CXXCH cytochrome family protein